MPNPELPTVTANRDFRSNHTGSRSKGEKFHYDVDKDPADLKKLGFIDIDGQADSGGTSSSGKGK